MSQGVGSSSSTTTEDQQFLTRSADWSTAFRNKLGAKAHQGFEHLMEYATFLLTLTESQATDEEAICGVAM
jgi:hypothetical protein